MKLFKLSEKCRIIKNLIVINLSFLLVFSAFNSVASVQGVLNQHENLGITTYFVMFALQILTCLIFPKILFDFFGYKWSMVICQVFFLLYICFQALPEWYTLMPTCILCGFALSIIWNLIGIYVTILAKNYSKLTNSSFYSAQLVFFGITGSIFLLSFTLGAVLIGTILKTLKNNRNLNNETFYDYSNNCGSNNCPQTQLAQSETITLKESVYWLCGSLDLLMVISIIITITLLDDIKDNLNQSKSFKKKLHNEARNLFEITLHKNIWLLFSISIYTGFELTYIWFEFNRGFVSCLYGLNTVSWTNGLLGILGSLLSLILGYFLKYVGPIPGVIIMLSAAFCQCIFGLAWIPNNNSKFVVFLMVVGFSVSQSIASGQVRGLYGIYVRDDPVSFSYAAFSQSIGFFLGSIISVYFCTRIKLYVYLGIIFASFISYALLLISNNTKSLDQTDSKINSSGRRETDSNMVEIRL